MILSYFVPSVPFLCFGSPLFRPTAEVAAIGATSASLAPEVLAGSSHAVAAGWRLPGPDRTDATGAEQLVARSAGGGTEKWRLVGPGEVGYICLAFSFFDVLMMFVLGLTSLGLVVE